MLRYDLGIVLFVHAAGPWSLSGKLGLALVQVRSEDNVEICDVYANNKKTYNHKFQVLFCVNYVFNSD